MEIKKIGIFFLVVIVIAGIIGCSADTTDSSPSEQKGSDTTEPKETSGGTLNVAYLAQPQTLDPHITTANATRDPARLIFETLVTLNENYEVTPQLAESYEISEDGTTITFKLREGIKFHNGTEMTAEDVVASMTKWGESAIAKANLGEHEWVAKDKYTVELHFEGPSSVIMYVLADIDQFAAIMPKEVIDSAGPSGITEYIGTGPFKLENWAHDQHMLFTRFEEYQPVDEPASGLAGKKEALVDEIYFHFVPDESTRVNGLLSGEYDFAHMLPYDAIPQLENVPNIEIDIWPFGIQALVFNKKEGLFRDVRMRQAVNYALNKEEILTAAFTSPKYFELDPSLFLPEQTDWYTDAGQEYYNQQDLEKAKQLLQEAGYNGEEVIILTSRDYAHHYNSAVATQQQLQEIGINAKLEVYDWATLLERRDQPELWDIFFTGFPTSSTPHQYTFLDTRANWPGWTNNPEFDRLLDEIKAQTSQEEAKALYAELQQLMWEDLPIINIGRNLRVSAYSDKVQGYQEFKGPVFWNVSISE
ncbi:peptide ABC transporter substrate-binding protein [Caldalkalibacillus thermarum]|uniref:ABC transporter substrate-binding protein n=1 Tax=Caldalkalibacillus thermarum TaxID=296745 RepID=UPI001666EDA3|nr:ABC transporter substrate-binding protein [Caldalkalibacillus thermarum]GGK29511.1 peptide ABC transporter substrate-binding protein [Caldalkalibacillus thermarum]